MHTKEIRDRLGVEAGSKLDFRLEDDGTLRVRKLDRVLAELAWVLRSRYAVEPLLVGRALRALLGNATLAWQSPAAVADALELHEAGGVDFAGCLVTALAAARGCEGVATFDRGMRSLPGVRLL